MHPDDVTRALGVRRTASLLQARAAYRRLALLYHPDRNPGDPSAAAKFRKVVRAYRVFANRGGLVGKRGDPEERPPGPRPDRYGCGKCGDSFPFPLTCPRCEVALFDRCGGEPVYETDLEVQAFERELERRAIPCETWFSNSWMAKAWERVPVPAALVAASLVAAWVVSQFGPLGMALLFVGFAAYVTSLELHRRARESFAVI